MHLAVLILLVILATNLVDWIGKPAIIELFFTFVYAPLFLRSTQTRQTKLKRQILENKAQLQKTSSQDEFAKWAKLKRNLDKGLKDLEALNSALQSSHSAVNSRLSLVLTVLTSGLQLGLVAWHRKTPVFYLPPGWIPGPVAWLLSFSGGVKGTISVAAWSVICKRCIKTMQETLGEWIPSPAKLLALITRNPTQGPVLTTPVSASTGGGEKPSGEKKDL